MAPCSMALSILVVPCCASWLRLLVLIQVKYIYIYIYNYIYIILQCSLLHIGFSQPQVILMIGPKSLIRWAPLHLMAIQQGRTTSLHSRNERWPYHGPPNRINGNKDKMETTSSKDGCIRPFLAKTLRSSFDNARSKTLGMMRATSGNTSEVQCHHGQWWKMSCLSSSPVASSEWDSKDQLQFLNLLSFSKTHPYSGIYIYIYNVFFSSKFAKISFFNNVMTKINHHPMPR